MVSLLHTFAYQEHLWFRCRMDNIVQTESDLHLWAADHVAEDQTADYTHRATRSNRWQRRFRMTDSMAVTPEPEDEPMVVTPETKDWRGHCATM